MPATTDFPGDAGRVAQRRRGFDGMNDLTRISQFEPNPVIVAALCPEDMGKLLALYGFVVGRGRRDRFGGGLSDFAVERGCRSLDWSRYLAVGAFYARRLDAVFEMFCGETGWDELEIAALFARRLRDDEVGALLGAGVAEAKARGARWLVLHEPDPFAPWLKRLAQFGAPARSGDRFGLRIA